MIEDAWPDLIEESWVELLASIYKSVNWKKIARKRSSYDIFEHRVERAKYYRTVEEFIQKLLNLLSLQLPPLPIEAIEILKSRNDEAMQILRRKTKYLCLKAILKAKEKI